MANCDNWYNNSQVNMSETSICKAAMDPSSWEFSNINGEDFVMVGAGLFV